MSTDLTDHNIPEILGTAYTIDQLPGLIDAARQLVESDTSRVTAQSRPETLRRLGLLADLTAVAEKNVPPGSRLALKGLLMAANAIWAAEKPDQGYNRADFGGWQAEAALEAAILTEMFNTETATND